MSWLLNKASWGTWGGRGKNAYLQGTVTRAGNTVTISNLSLYFAMASGYGYGTSSDTVKILDVTGGGTELSSTSVTWNMGTQAAPKSVSNTVYLNNATLTVSATTTSRKLALTATGGDYAEFDINFPSGATQPSGLAISAYWAKLDTVEVGGQVADFGTGVGPNVIRVLVGQTMPLDKNSQFNYEESDTQTYTATVTNNSPKMNGGVNIIPNARYTLGVYASNGTLDKYYTVPLWARTWLAKDTLTLEHVTDTIATIRVDVPADGGASDKTIQYKLATDNDWTTLTTVQGGEARTYGITLTGLTPNTTYVLKSRSVDDNEVAWNNDDFTFTTLTGVKPFYGSVNGQTKAVKKLYGSVNGQTKEIKKLYGSVNGQTKRIF